MTRGKLKFGHKSEFPCVKQPTDSMMEAFYAIHHMREFVRDQEQLQLTSSLAKWGQYLANITDRDLRQEIYRIQDKIAQLIHTDVLNKEGMFYYGPRPPTKDDIKVCLDLQRDGRKFNTLEGVLLFPPTQKDN